MQNKHHNYAQAFFKSDEKDNSRESSGGSKGLRVRQVIVDEENATQPAASSTYFRGPEIKIRARFSPESTVSVTAVGHDLLLFVFSIQMLTVDTFLQSVRSLKLLILK